VVEDLATARAIRTWFLDEWRDGGSLLLLPIQALHVAESQANGGAKDPSAWVDTLLPELLVIADDPLQELHPGAARVGSRGEVVDARGVVRLGSEGDGSGILSRRQALARLREEMREALRLREARFLERDGLRSSLADAEERVLVAEERLRVLEAKLRGLELDAAAHRDRRTRLQQERESLEATTLELRSSIETADERLTQLERRLESLAAEVAAAGAEEGETRERLANLQASWESARDEEAERRVVLARAEAALAEVERRIHAAENARDELRLRSEQMAGEAADLRAHLEDFVGVREGAAGEVQELFALRDQEIGALALLDARLAEVDSELAELGERTRV